MISECLSPGCGPRRVGASCAYSVAQSGYYVASSPGFFIATITLLSFIRNIKQGKYFQIIHLIKSKNKFVYDIGVPVARLWPCMFCRSIRVLRRSISGVIHCGHYASVKQVNRQFSKQFQIICRTKNILSSGHDIGVTVAGLWPCIFCGLIRVLRRIYFQSLSMRTLRFCRTRNCLIKKNT
jgi:hypothetical protein